MFRRSAVAALVACALAALVLTILSPRLSAADRNPGDLGMIVGDLSREVRRAAGYRGHGVVILQVFPGGPADTEGLREGDIIFEFESHDVTTAGAIAAETRELVKGELVSIKYWRDGSTGWELLTAAELVPVPSPEELDSRARADMDDRFADLAREFDERSSRLENGVDERIASLERELDELRARIATLEGTPTADSLPPLDEEPVDQ